MDVDVDVNLYVDGDGDVNVIATFDDLLVLPPRLVGDGPTGNDQPAMGDGKLRQRGNRSAVRK